MRHGFKVIAGLALSCFILPAAGEPAAQAGPQGSASSPQAGATSELKNRDGQTVGRARLTETPNGVLLRVELERAPEGEHAFHIHQTGRCDAPSFESAGGHFNPGKAGHGFHDAKGPHAGDLPNIIVPSGGRLTFEYMADGVTLTGGKAGLLDADGAALVMHAKPDDYRTDPAGAAGDRLACGVIQKR